MRRAVALSLIALILGIGLGLYGAEAERELVIWQLPQAGSRPAGVAWTKNTVYATLYGADTLAALDLRTGRVDEIPVGDGPYGIVVEDGYVYVTLSLEDRLAVFRPTTETLHKIALPTPGGRPDRLIAALWSPNAAHLGIAEPRAGRIARFQMAESEIPAGGSVEPTTSRIPLTASTIYARSVSVQPQTVLVYPLGAGPTSETFVETVRGPFTEWQLARGGSLEDLSFEASGRFWIARRDATLLRLDPMTGAAEVYALPLKAQATLVDAAGYGGGIVFFDAQRGALGELDLHTGNVTLWPLPGARDVVALAFDAEDRIWFADRDADVVGSLDRDANTFTLYDLPAGSGPVALTPGLDGLDLWFAAQDGNYIGKLGR